MLINKYTSKQQIENAHWLINEAKEMERQQTIDFANDCIEKWDMTDEILDENFIEKQYNETFENK